ncbi:hypothetical protein [Streptomyces sp. NPDC048489]|uniref:hypothetical protein n=1 Tax=Streptomyces sp. NPDC048489 TaxID=3154504 RepID=UPI0034315E29
MRGRSPVTGWNTNKPHRCPQCAYDVIAAPSRWEVYTCCNCATRFARYPRMQRILRHTGIMCEVCTEQIPVRVNGQPFGFLRRRHAGRGFGAPLYLFESWLYDTDHMRSHGGIRYLNTRPTRADAMAELAWKRSVLGPVEDDPSPVIAVIADEETFKYGLDSTDEQQSGLRSGALEVYRVGVLRQIPAPHPRRGQFYTDPDPLDWDVAIAPAGLEGLYTHARHLPEPLAAHAPQLRP